MRCDCCGRVVVMPTHIWFPYPWFCDACKPPIVVEARGVSPPGEGGNVFEDRWQALVTRAANIALSDEQSERAIGQRLLDIMARTEERHPHASPGERTPPTCATCRHHSLQLWCGGGVARPLGQVPTSFGCTLHEPGEAPPSAPPPAETLTCLKTGNECGTDAWMIGADCKCANCQRYQHSQRYNRAAEAPAETPRETPVGCDVQKYSSAVCRRGTRSCVIDHEPAPRSEP